MLFLVFGLRIPRLILCWLISNRYVTFLCGQPGIYALGAAAAKCRGDQRSLDRYLGLFHEVTTVFSHQFEYLKFKSLRISMIASSSQSLLQALCASALLF